MSFNVVREFVNIFLSLFVELFFLFILITFLVGLLQEYIRSETIKKVLSRGKYGLGNIIGAFFGSLTPFCTCSTIPVMLGLFRAGVPFGIVISFFFASPLLNPIIVGLMLYLFGLHITLIYISILFPAAVLFGIILDKLGYAEELKPISTGGGCCGNASNNGESPDGNFIDRFMPRAKRSLNYAFNLFRQMAIYILIGSLIGAFVRGFIPEDIIVRFAGPDNPFAIPVASIIGIPMYIRAAAILPISSALVEQGMSLGAVMALVIGATGGSLPEITMLSSIFKRKLLITYLIIILVVAILAGFLFNFLVSVGL